MKAVKKKKDFTRGSVRVFFSYYTPHRKLLLLDLVMAVFAVAAELVFPYATRYALNRLLPNGLYKAFFLLMAGLLGAYLLRALAQYIVTVYGHELGVRVEADMREHIFAKVQTLSFAFFDKHRTGKLMSRMTTDLFDITELAHHGPETVIQASLTIAGAIVILATIRWELALILFLLLPVLLAVVMRLRLRLRARSLDVKRETAEINTAVEAGVSGIRTVKAFANEQDAMDKFRTSNEKFKKVKKSYYRIFGVFNASTEFAMALMQLVTLAAGGVFIMQGKMDAVDLITFSLYVSVFMAPIRKLTQFVEQFQKGSSGFLRFLEIMRTEPDVKDAPDAKELTDVKGGVFIMQGKMDAVDLITFSLYVSVFMAPIRKLTQFVEQFQKGSSGFLRFLEIMRAEPDVKDAPDAKELENVKGGVEYRDVSFHYQNGEEVLRHVDLTIAPGETLALVGPSGSGKTTLSQLLPRFYDVTGGAVLVDGQDVRKVTQASLHRYIGIIQQDVFLFADTVRENIRYGRPGATDEEVAQAAILASIHEEILEMPNGYDTFVGERGAMLSGGQKQRIAIARVFLKNPPILVLDEATSALDSVTEAAIQASLEKLSRGRTTIVVAHRLATVRGADHIAVIDKEGVSEYGTHQELMEKNGLYAALWNTQKLS